MKRSLFIFMVFATILFFNPTRCVNIEAVLIEKSIQNPTHDIDNSFFDHMKKVYNAIYEKDLRSAKEFLQTISSLLSIRENVGKKFPLQLHKSYPYESFDIKYKVHSWIKEESRELSKQTIQDYKQSKFKRRKIS